MTRLTSPALAARASGAMYGSEGNPDMTLILLEISVRIKQVIVRRLLCRSSNTALTNGCNALYHKYNRTSGRIPNVACMKLQAWAELIGRGIPTHYSPKPSSCLRVPTLFVYSVKS